MFPEGYMPLGEDVFEMLVQLPARAQIAVMARYCARFDSERTVMGARLLWEAANTRSRGTDFNEDLQTAADSFGPEIAAMREHIERVNLTQSGMIIPRQIGPLQATAAALRAAWHLLFHDRGKAHVHLRESLEGVANSCAYGTGGASGAALKATLDPIQHDIEVADSMARVAGWNDDTPVLPEILSVGEQRELPASPHDLEPSFEVFVDPGNASREEIQAVFTALSDLHRAAGGLGLEFHADGNTVLAVEEACR
jgi:hypothetical protein